MDSTISGPASIKPPEGGRETPAASRGPQPLRSDHGSERRRHLVGQGAALRRGGTPRDPRRFRCRGLDRAPAGVARRGCHRSARRRHRGCGGRAAARRADRRGHTASRVAVDGPHPLRQSIAREAVARGGRGADRVRSGPDGRRHRHVPEHGVTSRRAAVPGLPTCRVGRAGGQGRRRRVLGPRRCRTSTVPRGAPGRRRWKRSRHWTAAKARCGRPTPATASTAAPSTHTG